MKPTVNKWSTCSKERVGAWANDIIKLYGKHCKDTSAPACEDLCPGSRCTVKQTDVCQNPSTYGGCNGSLKSYFDKLCRKSCKICTDTSTATTPKPAATTTTKPATTTPKPTPATTPKPPCKDICPGDGCYVSPNYICQYPSWFGGCSGIYSAYFNQYCKKSCGIC